MIEYNKVEASQADMLAKVRVDFLSEINQITDNGQKELLLNNNREYMSKALSDGSFICWAAMENKSVVGMSSVSFYSYPPSGKCPNGRVAYISGVFTYLPYRGRGIATKLFSLVLEEAKAVHCSKIILSATEMGRKLYKKFGFTDVDNDMAYYENRQ